MKKLLIAFLLLFSVSSFADCGVARPTNTPEFCADFNAIAICHCQVDGGGRLPCKDADQIYDLMMARFATYPNPQQAACDYAAKKGSPTRVPAAQCMAEWNCYKFGAGNCFTKCSKK